MARNIHAGVIGAAGYAGAELVRLLAGHPHIKELSLGSVSFEGRPLYELYPNFLRRINPALVKPEEAAAAADVVFAALPNGVGEPFAKTCVEKNIPFIDFSADFRFGGDQAAYRAWYGMAYQFPNLREHAVYGLPELNRQALRERAGTGRIIIANPGCYPTAASLAAYPALARGMLAEGTVIVDAASGITGGGRETARSFHYPECADSLSPYKVGCHRHTPEIQRNFAAMTAKGGKAPALIFTPHLAPMNRGILSTLYAPLAGNWRAGPADPMRPPSPEAAEKERALQEAYAAFYQNEPFVRVLPAGINPATGRVRGSNYCDIAVRLDQTGSFLIAVSAIDNMVKGAAGQAVQNMNILFGFDETAGLEAIPASF
ncbi:MAG: N-acetyl-gamma-glutamyl-phosphate reductase [Spirochaetaceae bacterium]|jgi:N-acetyl-gamma-glutamyl-phosphate reductase|nr:N-acetyl-gamma-glutamyl-phosphate reductase [Spirochaetaceae bacterium]